MARRAAAERPVTDVAPDATGRQRLADAMRRHPLALIWVGVVLYSTGSVFAAAADATGPTFSFWRLWIGVVVLGTATLAAVRFTGAAWPSLRTGVGRASWRYAGWAGVWFGVHQLAFFTAVQQTSVADVMLMNTLAPVLVALAATRLFGERPGWPFRAWTAVAIAGAAVIVLGASAGPEGNPAGMALALLNVACFTAFFLVSKQGRTSIGVLPFLLGTVVVAALTVSGYVLVAGEDVTVVTSRDLVFVTIVAIGPGAIGHVVMTWPLRWVAANLPPLMRLAQPLIAGFLAWILLGQAVTVWHLVGGTMTLLGVAGALLGGGGRRLRAGVLTRPGTPRRGRTNAAPRARPGPAPAGSPGRGPPRRRTRSRR